MKAAGNPVTSGLTAWWDHLARRERRMVALAIGVIVLALIWWLAIAPALRTLREAPVQLRQIDRQIQQMRVMADEARALQAETRVGADEALRALELSVRNRLGANAQLSVAGDRATVTLKGVPPDVLAAWLAHVRQAARALPTDARLQRNPVNWDGTISLQLASRG